MVRPPRVIDTAAADRGMLATLIAGSNKPRHLLFAETDDEVFITRSLNVTPKTTEMNSIVCTGESEAKATNNKNLRSRYCTAEANY